METATPPGDARVSPALVGRATAPTAIAWDERETILYALGVGAGLGDPALTTENSAGVTLQALPSLLTILTNRQSQPSLAGLDVARFLHAEQAIVLHRPLPPCGSGMIASRIVAVYDKGENAMIDSVATLEIDGRAVGESRMRTFVRGGGGFGGDRGDADAWSPPDREPDTVVRHETRPEQALLYRLSGDRHRLHSDPAFARGLGFDRPILHGLATYGFACRALVRAGGGDAGRLRSMAGRFSRPVVPGDTLSTEIWLLDDGMALFRTRDDAGATVLDRGTARFVVPPARHE